ncbi:MAG: type II secretion system major pseudopilin GspG [Proteobacteria bacterium]|nr:type II secretion system major pseudopilin GspG [Pseudomonadota bacterium]
MKRTCVAQQLTGQIRNGFTLIELLIVLVILSLLGGIVGPRVMKHLGKAKTDTARLQIDNLSAALDIYNLENGSYPSTEVGLDALINAPEDATSWNGPYLRKPNVPLDPWGKPFNYRFPGEHGVFDIYTLGADNAEGGEKDNQDVASWD